MTYNQKYLEKFSNSIPDSIYNDLNVKNKFIEKIKSGNISKIVDPISHMVVYFLPFNPKTKQVWLVFDNRIGGKWISPGGHIEKDEMFKAAVVREVDEELGLKINENELDNPFLIFMTKATNPNRPCVDHFDVWFLVNTDGKNFRLTEDEFSTSKWLNMSEAKKIVTDPSTVSALNRLGVE